MRKGRLLPCSDLVPQDLRLLGLLPAQAGANTGDRALLLLHTFFRLFTYQQKLPADRKLHGRCLPVFGNSESKESTSSLLLQNWETVF